MYGAQSWAKERRVITRLEYGEQGNNPRYLVSKLDSLILPQVNTECMQLFLDEVFAHHPYERIG